MLEQPHITFESKPINIAHGMTLDTHAPWGPLRRRDQTQRRSPIQTIRATRFDTVHRRLLLQRRTRKCGRLRRCGTDTWRKTYHSNFRHHPSTSLSSTSRNSGPHWSLEAGRRKKSEHLHRLSLWTWGHTCGRTSMDQTRVPDHRTYPSQELIKAVLGPNQVAVRKCKGHQKLTNSIAQGNDAADAAAKQAGGYQKQLMVVSQDPIPSLTEDDIATMQEKGGPYENSQWLNHGASKDVKGLWSAHSGRLAVPAKLAQILFKQAHGPTHISKKQTQKHMETLWWHPHMEALVENFVHDCDICNAHNPKRPYKCPMGRFPVPDAPFKEICIDFTDTDADHREQGYRYMLVDRYTKWLEAIPCRREDAKTVIKWLRN